MKYFVYIFILCNSVTLAATLAPSALKSQKNALKTFFSEKWKLNQNSLEHLSKGEVLTEADVKSHKAEGVEFQEFSLRAAGWHNKKCSLVLRKLSKLESFQEWISFIKSSTYEEKSKLFTLTADHTLLPYPMIVHILMDRPEKEGTYPFTFPTGIFTGLKGEYIIKEVENRCLIFATSYWKGKSTKIPNLVIELFSETLSKNGAELLMRKTQF